MANKKPKVGPGRGHTKPTRDHIRDGTFRESVQGDRADILLADGVPIKPPGLSDEASEAWDFLLEHLNPKVLARVDRMSMEMLCDAWGEYKYWMEAAKIHRGVLDQDTDRIDRKVKSAQQVWLKIQQQFGLTPRSRQQLRIPQEKQQQTNDPFELLMPKRN